MLYDVVCLGMINADVSVPGFDAQMIRRKQSYVPAIQLNPGGDAMNCATTVSLLGLKTALCGRIGDDGQGAVLLAHLQAAGVDIGHIIQTKGGQTGTVVNLIQHAEASHIAAEGENDRFSDADIPDYLLASATVVSLHSLFGCGTVGKDTFARAKAFGAVTVADTTNLPEGASLDEIAGILSYTDYFLPSRAEALQLADTSDVSRAATVFHACGVPHVVIKTGEEGCFCSGEDFCGTVAGFPAQPVDLTGCGDHFVAAFIAGLVRGQPFRSCAVLGNAAGALCAGHLGATGAAGTYEELTDWITQKGVQL